MNCINSQKPPRDSNMELLRIIAMFMVVMDHLLLVGNDSLIDYQGPLSGVVIFRYLFLSVTFAGVILFVMISGYYGIKFRWSKLLELYLTCVFYGLICEGIHMLYTPDFGWKHNCLYVLQNALSPKMWWFINTYVCLSLFSPLINAALDSITKQQHKGIILLLLIQTCFQDWMWDTCINAINFILFYVIGRYLGKYGIEKVNHNNWWYLVGWLTSTAIFFGLSLLKTQGHCNLMLWEYNNPLLIFSAICLLMIFTKFSFHSKSINWIAAGTLSVYLIHVGPWLGNDFFEFLRDRGGVNTWSDVILYTLIGLIILLIISSLDVCRRFFFKITITVFKKATRNIFTH